LSREREFAVRICEERFTFASSHFLIFDGGEREPLHGHNYRLSIKGSGPELSSGMLFDFTKLTPIMDRICHELDHLVLLPANNSYMTINDAETNHRLELPKGEFFSIPKRDAVILPISNTSAELLAEYIAQRICRELDSKFGFQFGRMEVEVEESSGNSAFFVLNMGDC
jgi:6-pyruvoyltetrahydropterin/6-carboxytetrahydropterin synthase